MSKENIILTTWSILVIFGFFIGIGIAEDRESYSTHRGCIEYTGNPEDPCEIYGLVKGASFSERLVGSVVGAGVGWVIGYFISTSVLKNKNDDSDDFL